MNAGFQRFWQTYPRKTAKLAALKAWDKAIRLDTEDNIIAGVERYKRNKPDYADWCFPATFLNQGRWMDEEDEPVVVQPRVYWWDECKEIHGGNCVKQWEHETRKLDERQAS